MKRRTIGVTAVMTILAWCFFSTASAQELTVDGMFGIGKPPVSTEGTQWNGGFHAATDCFLWPFDRMGFGLRLAVNCWLPSIDKPSGSADAYTNPAAKGSATIYEVIPSVRLRTAGCESPISIFGQAGVGLYLLRGNSDQTGLAGGTPSSIQMDNGRWIGRWGLQIGPGISLDLDREVSMELFPQFNAVFNDNHLFQYYVTNIGLSIKF